MKRCKTIDGGEILLPEPMIQHIQSFLTGKEAGRTAVLSKSWYAAWLTRPALDFDKLNFNTRRSKLTQIPAAFEEFTTKTMRRYRDLNLNIESFRLRMSGWGKKVESLVNKLTVDALQIGATDLNLELRSIPQEVLRSKTLLRLSVAGCEMDGKVSFSQLKTLSLSNVFMKKSDAMIIDMIKCCVSIEELSLSNCTCLDFHMARRLTLARQFNLREHRKLRRLYLEKLDVRSLFFSDFSSRFPCLTDLSVVRCDGYANIKIVSTSLERISFVQTRALKAEFDVPNIRKFSYSGSGLPWLSIRGSDTMEWESDIAITCYALHTFSWFLSLHKLLRNLMSQQSRISLSLNLRCRGDRLELDYECFQALPEPAVLENLSIDAPVTFFFALLDCLIRVVCPKFITFTN